MGVRFDHAMLVTPAGVLMTLTGRRGSFKIHSVKCPSPCCLASLQAYPTASTPGAACKQSISHRLWSPESGILKVVTAHRDNRIPHEIARSCGKVGKGLGYPLPVVRIGFAKGAHGSHIALAHKSPSGLRLLVAVVLWRRVQLHSLPVCVTDSAELVVGNFACSLMLYAKGISLRELT